MGEKEAQVRVAVEDAVENQAGDGLQCLEAEGARGRSLA